MVLLPNHSAIELEILNKNKVDARIFICDIDNGTHNKHIVFMVLKSIIKSYCKYFGRDNKYTCNVHREFYNQTLNIELKDIISQIINEIGNVSTKYNFRINDQYTGDNMIFVDPIFKQRFLSSEILTDIVFTIVII